MKLDVNKFALAAAAAIAVIWVICSLIVVLLPGMSMVAGGHMMHTDFSGMNWNMHFTGFLVGGILWVLSAGVTAWLLASIYNRLL